MNSDKSQSQKSQEAVPSTRLSKTDKPEARTSKTESHTSPSPTNYTMYVDDSDGFSVEIAVDPVIHKQQRKTDATSPQALSSQSSPSDPTRLQIPASRAHRRLSHFRLDITDSDGLSIDVSIDPSTGEQTPKLDHTPMQIPSTRRSPSDTTRLQIPSSKPTRSQRRAIVVLPTGQDQPTQPSGDHGVGGGLDTAAIAAAVARNKKNFDANRKQAHSTSS